MGQRHVRTVMACPDARLVGVVDPMDVVVPVPVFRSLTSVNVAFDAVVIATPAATHAELAATAMQRGAHVLVEKPAATTLGDIVRLVDVARQTNRRFVAAHVERFNPLVAHLRARLLAFPRPRRLRFVRTGGYPVAPPRDVLWELAMHDVDLATWLLGPLTFEHAQLQRVEANTVSATLSARSASLASVEFVAAWSVPTPARYVEIDDGHEVTRLNLLQLSYADLDPLALQLRAFLAHLAGGTSRDLCTTSELAASTALLEAATHARADVAASYSTAPRNHVAM